MIWIVFYCLSRNWQSRSIVHQKVESMVEFGSICMALLNVGFTFTHCTHKTINMHYFCLFVCIHWSLHQPVWTIQDFAHSVDSKQFSFVLYILTVSIIDRFSSALNVHLCITKTFCYCNFPDPVLTIAVPVWETHRLVHANSLWKTLYIGIGKTNHCTCFVCQAILKVEISLLPCVHRLKAWYKLIGSWPLHIFFNVLLECSGWSTHQLRLLHITHHSTSLP